MLGWCRVLLVVHVVQEPGYTPLLLVLAELSGVGAHGGLDGEHVLAKGVALRPLAQQLPGLFAVHGPPEERIVCTAGYFIDHRPTGKRPGVIPASFEKQS